MINSIIEAKPQVGLINVNFDNIIKFVYNANKDKSKEYKIDFYKKYYPWNFSNIIQLIKSGIFKSADNFTNIGIVFGSSLHESPCDHPGFISDALYLPEIIGYLCRFKKIKFHSFLDADLYDLSCLPLEILSDYNLILTGDGEVNYITSQLIKRYQQIYVKREKPLMDVRYPKENEPFFSNAIEIKPTKSKSYMYGALHLLANPWSFKKNTERFIICAGGIGHLGTVSSMLLLKNLITGAEKLSNRHTYIIRGHEKKYCSIFKNWKKLGIDDKGYPKGKLVSAEDYDIIEAFPDE